MSMHEDFYNYSNKNIDFLPEYLMDMTKFIEELNLSDN